MGWDTRLTTEIIFNKQTYNSKWDVERALEEEKSIMKISEQELFSLVLMTEPQKMIKSEDDVDTMYTVIQRYNELIDSIKESEIAIYKLELLLEYWDDCHLDDGKAKNAPDDLNTPYLDGDFIKGDRYNTEN